MSAAARRALRERLESPDSGWSMGAPGAGAEFIRTPDEPTTTGPDQVVTARGGIRLDLTTDLLLVAHETPAGLAAVAVALRRLARTEPELARTIAAIRGDGIEDLFRVENPYPAH